LAKALESLTFGQQREKTGFLAHPRRQAQTSKLEAVRSAHKAIYDQVTTDATGPTVLDQSKESARLGCGRIVPSFPKSLSEQESRLQREARTICREKRARQNHLVILKRKKNGIED